MKLHTALLGSKVALSHILKKSGRHIYNMGSGDIARRRRRKAGNLLSPVVDRRGVALSSSQYPTTTHLMEGNARLPGVLSLALRAISGLGDEIGDVGHVAHVGDRLPLLIDSSMPDVRSQDTVRLDKVRCCKVANWPRLMGGKPKMLYSGFLNKLVKFQLE